MGRTQAEQAQARREQEKDAAQWKAAQKAAAQKKQDAQTLENDRNEFSAYVQSLEGDKLKDFEKVAGNTRKANLEYFNSGAHKETEGFKAFQQKQAGDKYAQDQSAAREQAVTDAENPAQSGDESTLVQKIAGGYTNIVNNNIVSGLIGGLVGGHNTTTRIRQLSSGGIKDDTPTTDVDKELDDIINNLYPGGAVSGGGGNGSGAQNTDKDQTAAGERFRNDSTRAGPTNDFTTGIGRQVSALIAAIPKDHATRAKLKNMPAGQRNAYIKAQLNNQEIDLDQIGDIKDNALYNELKKLRREGKIPTEKIKLGTLNKLLNFQNGMMGLNGENDVEKAYKFITRGEGSFDIKNADGTNTSINKDNYEEEFEKRYESDKGKNRDEDGPNITRYAKRSLADNYFTPEKEKESAGRPFIPDIDAARAQGERGNQVTEDEVYAMHTNIAIGQEMAKKAQLDQARGLAFAQDAFEVKQSVNEVIEKNKHQNPQQQQAALAAWRSKILTNPQYSPNAPGLTNEQRLQRAGMLQQTFNQAAATMQQAAFAVQRENAIVGMTNKIQAIAVDVQSGNYTTEGKFNLQQALEDINTAAQSPFISPTERSRAVQQGTAAVTAAFTQNTIEAAIRESGDGLIDPSSILSTARETLNGAVGMATGLTGQNADVVRTEVARAEGAILRAAQDHNETIIENDAARYKQLISIGNPIAADAIAEKHGGNLDSYRDQGIISQKGYNSLAGKFKLATKTPFGVPTTPAIQSLAAESVSKWEQGINGSGDGGSFSDMIDDIFKTLNSDEGRIKYSIPQGMKPEELKKQIAAGMINAIQGAVSDSTTSGQMAKLFYDKITTVEKDLTAWLKANKTASGLSQSDLTAATSALRDFMATEIANELVSSKDPLDKVTERMGKMFDKKYVSSFVNILETTKNNQVRHDAKGAPLEMTPQNLQNYVKNMSGAVVGGINAQNAESAATRVTRNIATDDSYKYAVQSAGNIINNVLGDANQEGKISKENPIVSIFDASDIGGFGSDYGTGVVLTNGTTYYIGRGGEVRRIRKEKGNGRYGEPVYTTGQIEYLNPPRHRGG